MADLAAPAGPAAALAAHIGTVRVGVRFSVVALLASWAPWAVLLATTGDPGADGVSLALFVLGGLGPGLAAVVTLRVGLGPGLGRDTA